METILQDLRYASRILWKQPGFALTAILTLAVGIGANTAIYSVVDATLLRTLPFNDPDRLMRVALTWPERYGRPAVDDGFWSYPKYKTFRQLQQVFEDVALYREGTFNLTGTDEAERLRAEVVSAGYFPILGIRTQVGRLFLPEEDATPDTHAVAILGYGLWQRRFGGDQTIVGRNISLDNRSYTVVGVLPAGFQGLTGGAEIWLPTMTSGAREISMPFWHYYQMKIGRT